MRRLAVLSSAFGISACGLTVTGREFVVNAFGGNSEDREHFPPNPIGDAVLAFSLPR